jgi:hypothetical protein
VSFSSMPVVSIVVKSSSADRSQGLTRMVVELLLSCGGYMNYHLCVLECFSMCVLSIRVCVLLKVWACLCSNI